MKINRKSLKKLILEEIKKKLNEDDDLENLSRDLKDYAEELTKPGSKVPDRPGRHRQELVKSGIRKMKDFAKRLHHAMFAIGSDINVFGILNKYTSGLGTDEKEIKDVFKEIKAFADSDEASSLFNTQLGRKYKFRTPAGVLRYVAKEVEQYNSGNNYNERPSLGDLLISELGENSQDIKELNGIIPGFLKHIKYYQR